MANDKYLDLTGLSYYHNRIATTEFASQTDLDNLEDRVDDIVSEGGEPNVIDDVKVNNVSLPISNKSVNIDLSDYATEDYVETHGGKIDKIKVNGAEQTISNKEVNITVPTKTSELTNDSSYQNATQVQGLIDSAIEGITQFDYQVVSLLPSTGEKGIIYLVSHSHGSSDIYDEYIWLGSSYEKIGNTDIDLTQYWSKTELVAITTAEIDAIIDGA